LAHLPLVAPPADETPVELTQWASGVGLGEVRDRLVEKYLAALDGLCGRFGAAGPAAQLYASACLRLNAFGVEFGSSSANSLDESVHEQWAAIAPQQEVKDQLAQRIRRIFEVMCLPEVILPRLEVRCQHFDGVWKEQTGNHLVLNSVRRGEEAIGKIRILNTGGGKFTLAYPRLTGSIAGPQTVVRLPTEPASVLSPAEVLVTYKADRPGEFKGRLSMQAFSPEFPKWAFPVDVELEVTVRGLVLQCTPPAVEFGAVKVGTLRHQRTTVRNLGTATASIPEAQIQPFPGPFDSQNPLPKLPAEGYTIPRLPVGEGYTITLDFRPEQAGEVNGTLILFYRDLDTDPLIEQPTKLHGIGAVPLISLPGNMFGPFTLDFGSVTPPGRSIQPLVIHNPSQVELVVKKIYLGSPDWEIDGFRILDGNYEGNEYPRHDIVIGVRRQYTLQIAFDGMEKGGLSKTPLIIESDAGNMPQAIITLAGKTPSPKLIQINPDYVDFGGHYVSEVVQPMEVRIRNVGQSELEIKRVWIESPTAAFSIVNSLQLPKSLVRCGDFLLVTVAFMPRNGGEHKGTLFVESDATMYVRNGITHISLYGEAK
jgi:hypothetical protein